MSSAERAIDALRRGHPVRVTDGDAAIAVLAIELADPASLAAFEGGARANVLLTDKRAAFLGLGNQLAAAGMRAGLIERSPWLDLDTARAVADPVLDLATPLKGPFRSLPIGGVDRAARAALSLAKHAGLLPALFVIGGGAALLSASSGMFGVTAICGSGPQRMRPSPLSGKIAAKAATPIITITSAAVRISPRNRGLLLRADCD